MPDSEKAFDAGPSVPPAMPQSAIHPPRGMILPKRSAEQPAISRGSWALFAVIVAAFSLLFWHTCALVLPSWIRWAVSALWLGGSAILGILDFVTHTKLEGEIDSVPVDRWTVAHVGAGLVFGVWYLPVWAVVLITVGWEVFEMKVVGFGDKESLKNRAVDVAVALGGWLLVVLLAIGTTFPPPAFPLR